MTRYNVCVIFGGSWAQSRGRQRWIHEQSQRGTREARPLSCWQRLAKGACHSICRIRCLRAEQLATHEQGLPHRHRCSPAVSRHRDARGSSGLSRDRACRLEGASPSGSTPVSYRAPCALVSRWHQPLGLRPHLPTRRNVGSLFAFALRRLRYAFCRLLFGTLNSSANGKMRLAGPLRLISSALPAQHPESTSSARPVHHPANPCSIRGPHRHGQGT